MNCKRCTLESWFTNLQNKHQCLYLLLFLLRITGDVCTSGVTDETDVAEPCTDVEWISLVACPSGVTGETILAGTSSGVDRMTFTHNNRFLFIEFKERVILSYPH